MIRNLPDNEENDKNENDARSSSFDELLKHARYSMEKPYKRCNKLKVAAGKSVLSSDLNSKVSQNSTR